MQNLTTKLLAAAALVAVAGCAKKAPEQLPPPPPTETTPAPETSQPTGPVGSTVVPGSKEDFLQQVGSDRVLFATDQYDLSGEARATLDSQAAWLAKYPNVRITIEGHADERGTREYNLALGDRRANSAKNYLATKIDAGRISTVSYGKERPEVAGSDEGAWAQNRRAVTVVITGM
ncbi:peptidoglycan-associated lipoprotein [Sphingomonas laterariae]|uniref:Peptidoglycan-associated lipoprotein n=1 Tax=Edaphosphingomonas laterariae TaxID=861865 RepID=A0A239FWA8_9SPHN|nr:peptidoglycan-associated lipoprotein Pal [Sphingomonas laterariae]SNS60798.1 peptidoglycan-associated lipoprotein [Sphingomonas laterariae]